MEPQPLFSNRDIFGVIQDRRQKARLAVQELPADTLLGASPDRIVDALVDQFRLDVPVIQDAAIYIADTREVRLDVRHDPRRMISDRTKPFYAAAHRTVIALPFEGDPSLFDVRPQSYVLNPPLAVVGMANSSSPTPAPKPTPRPSNATTPAPSTQSRST